MEEQIIKEVREKLTRLANKSNVEGSWDYNGWRKVTDSDMPFTQMDWNSTLITALNVAKKELEDKSGTKANCLIVSPECLAVISDNPLLTMSIYSDKAYKHGFGNVARLGTYSIYVNQYSPWNRIVIINENELLNKDMTNDGDCAVVTVSGIPTFNVKEL